MYVYVLRYNRKYFILLLTHAVQFLYIYFYELYMTRWLHIYIDEGLYTRYTMSWLYSSKKRAYISFFSVPLQQKSKLSKRNSYTQHGQESEVKKLKIKSIFWKTCGGRECHSQILHWKIVIEKCIAYQIRCIVLWIVFRFFSINFTIYRVSFPFGVSEFCLSIYSYMYDSAFLLHINI